MFKRTIFKLNKQSITSTMSNFNTMNPQSDAKGELYEIISEIKKKGDNFFGVLYSNHKRHTVFKPVEHVDYAKSLKRRNAYDYMNNFTTVVLPQIESFVERRLMDKFKVNLSQAEQEMVEDVYRMRRHLANLKTYQPKVEDSKLGNADEEESTETPNELFVSVNGDGFKFHDYADIGKYVLVPSHKRLEWFPSGCYGDYMKQEFEKTRLFSIMIREEGVKLIKAFNNITTHQERLKQIDFDAILNKRNNFKEEVKNYNTFSLYFQEIAYSLLKFLETSKKYEYKYLFTNPEIFDSLVTVLVKHLRVSPFNIFMMCPTSRNKIFESMIKTINDKLGNKFNINSKEMLSRELKISEEEFFPLSNFVDIVEKIRVFPFEFEFKDIFEFAEKLGIELEDKFYEGKTKETKVKFNLNLASYWDHCQHQWRPEDMREDLPGFKGFNSGLLLSGEGNGKSMLLTYLHAWAKDNGWFVISVGNVDKYLKEGFPVERHSSGIYFQPELAVHLLTEIKIANYQLLRTTPVDLKEYGKFNICGNYDEDPEANRILWDRRSQNYTNSWEQYNAFPEEEIIAQDHPDHTQRLSDFLPKPRSLLEIVNKGIENERMATNAFAELLHALKRSETVKTMFLVDNYNELFKPSEYHSYKYANFKDFDGKIPPHDIALPRMFIKFDGHFYKQGLKVCAVSLKKYHLHKFKPELIKFPRGYTIQPDNLKLDDLRKAIYYYIHTGFSSYYNEFEIQDLWQLSQGNWRHLHHDLMNHVRSIPSQAHWMSRKETKQIIQESRKF